MNANAACRCPERRDGSYVVEIPSFFDHNMVITISSTRID